ncbi:hypothetical protein [Brasilonema sp. UFV-L1]|uniref:hypothetical protein n=1 Tax=Brasilonema sp. UFV-L1 TaxID=2234130 RepID=UPI0030DC1859
MLNHTAILKLLIVPVLNLTSPIILVHDGENKTTIKNQQKAYIISLWTATLLRAFCYHARTTLVQRTRDRALAQGHAFDERQAVLVCPDFTYHYTRSC